MAWVFIRFRNGMDHCVDAELAPMILLGMVLTEEPGAIVRGAPMEDDPKPPANEKAVEPMPSISIDQPGMVYQHRPWEVVEFQCLKIHIPSEDLKPLARRWREARAADYCGIPFYRFVGNPWRCIVLLPAQRDALLELLDARAVAAEARAADFYKTLATPQSAFRKIQEARGVPKNAEIWGNDPRERFDPEAN